MHANISAIFKKIRVLSMSLPVMIMLYGCPYSSPYKLDAEPQMVTDDAILGNWETVINTEYSKEQQVKMSIGKKSEMEYSITFTGYLNDTKNPGYMKEDSVKGTAFISMVNDLPFLNISINGQTFIARMIYENNKLTLLPLAEKFTAKYVKTNAELRTVVEFHFKTRLQPVYDEASSLKEMVRVQ